MKDYNYPIFYLDGTCVHCGHKNVNSINKFGRIEKGNPIYPIYFMKCEKCGRSYFIRWDEDDNNEYTIPVPVSFNYIDEFIEILKSSFKNDK